MVVRWTGWLGESRRAAQLHMTPVKIVKENVTNKMICVELCSPGDWGQDEAGDGCCRASVQTLPGGSALCSLAEGGQSRSDGEGMQKTKATQRQTKSKATKTKTCG